VKKTINAMLDADEDDDLNTVSLSGYISATAASASHTSDNLVRVIYADGSIVDGTSSRGTAGSETVAEKLAEAREDDDVKAVVLRVNSPGGSALASEVMWREVELLKAKKPVVVSMGSMAASGGYYISCGADAILADRTTLTGSIGVFGLFGSIDKTLRNKLGVTVDMVRTNPSADMGSIYRPLSQNEVAVGMKQIEWVYSTFVGHVSAGRNMSYEAVDAIGGGRVWSGLDAMQIGLIDGFGGIREAINLAADRAGVASDFSIDQPSGPSTPFEAFMQALNSAKAARIKGELGEAMAHYNTLQSVLSDRGVQARLPYVIEIQ
jgi:protease-4